MKEISDYNDARADWHGYPDGAQSPDDIADARRNDLWDAINDRKLPSILALINEGRGLIEQTKKTHAEEVELAWKEMEASYKPGKRK